MTQENETTIPRNSDRNEDNSPFAIEGIDRILIPTNNLSLDLKYYSTIFGLKAKRRGPAAIDPFLDAFAILSTPNGMVLELVTPKQEYLDLFKSPIYCYTVQNLLTKKDLLLDNGCTIIGDTIDTKQGWGWFYTLNQAGILSQLQGPLPLNQSQ